MTPRAVLRLLAAWALVLSVACIVVRSHVALADAPASSRTVVASRWLLGKRIWRIVRDEGAPPDPSEASPTRGGQLVLETAIAEGPLSLSSTTFPLALVPGRDGVKVTLDGKVAFATVDDLLAAQAYDKAAAFLDPSLGMGTSRAIVLASLARDLGAGEKDVAERGVARRVRFERKVVGAAPRPRVTAATLDPKSVTDAVRDAAYHLARNVDDLGRFRYLVDATTDAQIPGYNWPRHAGTTYFLAQAAALLDDGLVRYACLKAAARMRDEMTKDCGEERCIAEDAEASVGASALALIAFAEIVRSGADRSYERSVRELARFLRSQQRADGELMHFYDRAARRPIDKQVMYFTGEAALALSRAHRITNDAADLGAASRALARLSGEGWSFFGSRYYFAEEHWTCQAMADLWDRAKDEKALAFCLRWHEYQRRLQHEEGDSPFDGEGSFGFGPIVTPRLTPASSRGEAAAAALEIVNRELASGAPSPHVDRVTAELLDLELRRAIAFVMREQLRPGPDHLFVRPDLTRGGVPGSPVDLQLRIDYAQHAGSMMTRWLAIARRAQ